MKNTDIKEMKSKGLFGKYIIKKADKSKIDKGAEYFVLRLNGDGDPKHVAACIEAVLTYARIIKPHLPLLAKDLFDRYGRHRVVSQDSKIGTVHLRPSAKQ